MTCLTRSIKKMPVYEGKGSLPGKSEKGWVPGLYASNLLQNPFCALNLNGLLMKTMMIMLGGTSQLNVFFLRLLQALLLSPMEQSK